MPLTTPVIAQVMEEQKQGHSTRVRLFSVLERLLKRPVVAFFTSFRFPVMIEDGDVDILEGVLQKTNLSNGLALMISSPGGDGIAAERVLNLCRKFSGTNEFWAMVPSRAKSAATMICFGASKIVMGPNSELGPVDPQITVKEGNTYKRFSACNVVESYDELFRDAVGTKGNLQPFLQQLSNYDARDIKELRAAISLSEDISIKSLASGMMKGTSPSKIKNKIGVFLSPKITKAHGRPIYPVEAKSCGLRVEETNPGTRQWLLIYELYLRLNNLVSTHASKCIETKTSSFTVAAPKS